jgi:hypothetical protein
MTKQFYDGSVGAQFLAPDQPQRGSPETELANKLAAVPLDQLHSEWPTIVPVRLSETERELLVNVLRRSGHAQTPKLWPDIKDIHDVIAGHLARNGLTHSCLRQAAADVQKLYAATLSSPDRKPQP